MNEPTVIELNHNDACKAIEYYLNNVVLKNPVQVVDMRATTDTLGGDKTVHSVRIFVEFESVTNVQGE